MWGFDDESAKGAGWTGVGPLLNDLWGSVILGPWLDALTLPGIVHGYFPLSRAWAAAEVAGGSVERFCRETGAPYPPGGMVDFALTMMDLRRESHRKAEKNWRRLFFTPAPAASAPSDAVLAKAEDRRLASAHALMAARSLFMPVHLQRPFPPVKWRVATEKTVAARHGARLESPASAFPPPPERPVRVSHVLTREECRLRFLAFDSRVGGQPDTAWARVIEPLDAESAPTVIFLHGIGVESEYWRIEGGRIDGLARSGVRVIRPEGPWHGRRRPSGWFGGEMALSQGPLGLLDLFEAWVSEVATLIGWARATSRGPVALSGFSMGALTSQVLAVAARHWPEPLCPDALLLMATSGNFVDLSLEGSLGRALDAKGQLERESWTVEALRRWAPLLEPHGAPAVPSENIVMVIGTGDDVTPFPGGLALAERWGIRPENLFTRPHGHFSLSLGIEYDAEPLARLLAVLGRPV